MDDAGPTPEPQFPAAIPMAVPLAIPAAKPKLPFIELVIGVACAWGMEGLVGVIVAIATFTTISAQGSPPQDFAVPPMDPILIFSLSACSGIFAAIVSWYFICHRRGKSMVEGFRLRLRERTWLLLGLVVGIVVPLAIHVLPQNEQGNSMMARMVSSERGFYAVAVFALIAPIVEELYYRGFIFTFLRDHVGGLGAVAIVSVWFGAAHGVQLFGDWLMLLIVVAMGTFWTYMRHVSGSLLPGLASHWIYNALLVGPGLILQ